jgi:hypothetical protein
MTNIGNLCRRAFHAPMMNGQRQVFADENSTRDVTQMTARRAAVTL